MTPTHDQDEALGMASRIAVMNAGRLVQIGPPHEIYERPRSRFVAGFVGAVNLFEEGGATVAVRPEKLRLSRERPDGPARAATVVSVGYQGGQSVVHLAADGLSLRAHLPSAAARGLARGEVVWAAWAAEDAVTLEC